MKRLIILFTFILPIFVFADLEDLPDIQTVRERVLDKRENFFLTSTDYKINPKVNPITGECCEEETDLVVAGSEPISLRRFFNHFAPYDAHYASWRY